MATRNWSGAVSGDWSNAGNWDTAPASGDDVIINTGSRNIDAGLSQGALDLNSLWVGPTYTGQIGNSDTAMLTISSAKIIIAGGGSQHYITNGNTNIDEFEVISIGSAGTGNLTCGGTITKLIVRMGHIKLYSGTTTTAYLMADGGSSSSASITHFAGTITTLFKMAGSFTSQDIDELFHFLWNRYLEGVGDDDSGPRDGRSSRWTQLQIRPDYYHVGRAEGCPGLIRWVGVCQGDYDREQLRRNDQQLG